MTKLLIDAGRSKRGWSRIGTFSRCPQLFAYENRLGLDLIPADALTRGSMGHIIQAHQHAIWGAQQGGVWVDEEYHTDPDVFLLPEEAMYEWCDRNQAGHEHIDRMLETFRRYMARHPEPPGRVLAVEYPMTAVLGNKNGQWGLWLLSDEERMLTEDGTLIEPTPLNVPGHPDHDKPITLSRRLDLVVEDRARRVYIWDHKNQARVKTSQSTEAYAIDGGFAAFRLMGQQKWGDRFGGVALNLIQTTEPWRVARPTVPPTPHRDAHYAKLLWRTEHELARLDIEEPNYWHWPKVQHEVTCVHRYGKCGGLNLCFYGTAGKSR